jgi:hypothetical protein
VGLDAREVPQKRMSGGTTFRLQAVRLVIQLVVLAVVVGGSICWCSCSDLASGEARSRSATRLGDNGVATADRDQVEGGPDKGH